VWHVPSLELPVRIQDAAAPAGVAGGEAGRASAREGEIRFAAERERRATYSAVSGATLTFVSEIRPSPAIRLRRAKPPAPSRRISVNTRRSP
jgi:hypothetical protein